MYKTCHISPERSLRTANPQASSSYFAQGLLETTCTFFSFRRTSKQLNLNSIQTCILNMRFVLTALVLAYLSTKVLAESMVPAPFRLKDEDSLFWDRFLQNDGSLSVTRPPSPGPTPGSIPPPAPGPTPEPTGFACDVDVTLDCKLPDGRPCDALTAPTTTQCAVGDDIDTVTFSFQFCICDPNVNRQGAEASCVDSAAVDFTQPIDMVCVDAATGAPMDVTPSTVAPLGTITVTAPGGGSLPDKISCDLSQNGQIMQTNVIDTSGDVNLNLRDKFGALQLESCDSEGTPELSCFETACYNVNIENVGTNDMDITIVDFDFNGDVESLLDDLDVTTLTPGQSTSVEVKKDVDVCIEFEYCAVVEVEANPPSDMMCQDTDTDKFTIVQPESTPFPSPAPTFSPTPAPTPGPTPQPTPEPTSAPTPTPTRAPTPGLTPEPTLAPIVAPTPPTTPEPSAMPTTQCELNLDVNCTIINGEFAGQACETPGVGVEPCRDRPTGATMLFNGGDCSQSDNRQFLKFTCVDLGPVPIGEGEMAYIVVTDAKGKGIVYHQGFVAVGSPYYLSTPEDEERFEADQRIMIYRDENTDSGNLLQEVQYHSSCSSNLELKNRFGASQLIEFMNELQGNVTCFASVDFDLDVVIPVEIEGSSATLVTLTVLTNFAGFLDLTDQVAGMEIPPGGSVSLSIPATLDLTQRIRYTILSQVTATANPSGQICTGTDFNSFFAGNVRPGSVPTAPPTRRPTTSPAPTPNPLETACGVTAGIICEYLNTESRVVGECTGVRDPREVSCSSSLPATGLAFRYLGGNGLPATVFITVQSSRSGEVFSEPVLAGSIFRADGDFGGEVEITISTLDSDGTAGDEIQNIPVDAACNEDDTSLTLGTTFGPLQLTGFENALGFMSTVIPIRLQNRVANTGGIDMILESATVTSAFQSVPFDAVTSEQAVDRNTEVIVFEETIEDYDFLEKYESGTTNNFALSAQGRGTVSAMGCSDETTYSF